MSGSQAARVFLDSFAKIPKPEYPLSVEAKSVGSTLWVYVASTQELLTIGRTQAAADAQERTYMQIKGGYSEQQFLFYYSFFKLPALPSSGAKEEPASSGIGEDFTTAAQEISTIIYTALADLVYRKPKGIDFFVICMADTTKGITVKTITHRKDVDQFVSGAMPGEEYHSRTLLKVKGSPDIIGDTRGKHLVYTDIRPTDFIIELVNQQTRMETSKLKEPDMNAEKVEEIIMKKFFSLTKAYEFDDYLETKLQEMPSGKTTSLTRYELQMKFGESSSL